MRALIGRPSPHAAALAAAALLATGCELQEVTVAEGASFVVVESYLRAGAADQHVALHASAGSAALIEPDAIVRLIAPDTTVVLTRTDPLDCLTFGYGIDERDFPGGLACYQTGQDSEPPHDPLVRAGELYRLTVELADSARIDGATRVPQIVAFASNAGTANVPCRLEPWSQLELSWNPVAGAAAFLLDMRLSGIREALAREGIVADVPDPLILRGLAIGNADTTIVLPAEFGLFDRFSLDPELSLALQRGVPAGVSFEVVVAAIDGNFVDWVRGGDFNPSGLIRTPSMFGDGGTGVVASLSTDGFRGVVESGGDRPACGT